MLTSSLGVCFNTMKVLAFVLPIFLLIWWNKFVKSITWAFPYLVILSACCASRSIHKVYMKTFLILKVLNAFGANTKLSKRQQHNVVIQQLFTIILLMLVSSILLIITIVYQHPEVLIQTNHQLLTKYQYCSTTVHMEIQFGHCFVLSNIGLDPNQPSIVD